jgi:hypothetical protein
VRDSPISVLAVDLSAINIEGTDLIRRVDLNDEDIRHDSRSSARRGRRQLAA